MNTYSSILEEVKSKITLSELIARDIEVRGRGNSKSCKCPFHEDKTPSMHIDDSKELFNCFGCPAGGDHINYLTEMHKMTFVEAVEHLCEVTATPIPKPETYDKEKAKQSARFYSVATKIFSILADGAGNRPFPVTQSLHDKLQIGRLLQGKKSNVTRLLNSQWHKELGLAPLVSTDEKLMKQTNGVYLPLKTLKDGIGAALFIKPDYSHEVILIHPTYRPEDHVINARLMDRKNKVYVAFDAASMVSINESRGIDNVLLLPHGDGIISARQYKTCTNEARSHSDLIFVLSADRKTHATALYHLLNNYSPGEPIQLQTLEGVSNSHKPVYLMDHIQHAWPYLSNKVRGMFEDKLVERGLVSFVKVLNQDVGHAKQEPREVMAAAR